MQPIIIFNVERIICLRPDLDMNGTELNRNEKKKEWDIMKRICNLYIPIIYMAQLPVSLTLFRWWISNSF